MSEPRLYPEHEKLTRTGTLSEFTNKLGAWLDTTDYAICVLRCQLCDGSYSPERHEREQLHDPVAMWLPVGKRIEALLADIFEVDLDALEREKQAMLDELRQQQAGQPDPEPDGPYHDQLQADTDEAYAEQARREGAPDGSQ